MTQSEVQEAFEQILNRPSDVGAEIERLGRERDMLCYRAHGLLSAMHRDHQNAPSMFVAPDFYWTQIADIVEKYDALTAQITPLSDAVLNRRSPQ
jgi:hypothetical protein